MEVIMDLPEKVIDEIADEIMAELEEAAEREGRKVTFDDIEKSLLLYRKKIGERMLQRSLDSVGTGKLEKKNVKIEGKKYTYKGIEPKKLITLLGEGKLARARYRSETDDEWYPLDEELGLCRLKPSKRFAKVVNQLTIFMPEEHVKKQVKSILDIDISVTFISQVVTRFGNTLHRKMEDKAKRPYAIEEREKDVDVLYVESDGAMTPLWGDHTREYKENKLGILFNNKDMVHKISKKGKETTRITRKKFISSIAEGAEPARKMLFAAAVEKGYYAAKHVIFLCDGASWLTKCREKYFPKAIQILDWYHAVEHLWETAKALYGDDDRRCKEWADPLIHLLWEGQVQKVIVRLEQMAVTMQKHQTVLYSLRTYYVGHADYMKYDEYRKNGWYIGSGAIESANKYIVAQRLKQSGMIWSKIGADAMIWARCKYFEGDWDECWDNMKMTDFLDKQPTELAWAS